MSSTGRGKERAPLDFYGTPAWVVWRLLDAHARDLGFGRHLNFPRILEPTVGDGAIVRAVDDWHANNTRDDIEHSFTGVELRRGAVTNHCTNIDEHFEGVDFRSWVPERRFDLALGNLPFSLAETLLRRVFTMADVVVMLLRLNFLGSDDRVPFFKEFPRPAIRVVPERISFDGEGSDSDYCAWFIWGSELRDVDVLDTTPLEIRNAHKPIGLPIVPQLGFDL